MRLLKEENGAYVLHDFLDEEPPPYAILSHTWHTDNKEEVSYQDIMIGNSAHLKAGYRKIKFCAAQAEKHGLEYFWIDTCCIDKTSSAELEFAINSMFAWYRNSARCYVFLADISISIYEARRLSKYEILKSSRWFTRGWTLQELIAPAMVDFFTNDSLCLGSKVTMASHISRLTRIPEPALCGSSLSDFPIDQRFTWVEGRRTKRQEDLAYCLLGIMGVRMRLDYGEQQEAAFVRLRKKIAKSHPDWNNRPPQDIPTAQRQRRPGLFANILVILFEVLTLPVTGASVLLQGLSCVVSAPARMFRRGPAQRHNIFSPLPGSQLEKTSAAALSAALLACARFFSGELDDRTLVTVIIAASPPLAMSLICPPKVIFTCSRRCFIDALFYMSAFAIICLGMVPVLVMLSREPVYPSLLLLSLFTICWLCIEAISFGVQQ